MNGKTTSSMVKWERYHYRDPSDEMLGIELLETPEWVLVQYLDNENRSGGYAFMRRASIKRIGCSEEEVDFLNRLADVMSLSWPSFDCPDNPEPKNLLPAIQRQYGCFSIYRLDYESDEMLVAVDSSVIGNSLHCSLLCPLARVDETEEEIDLDLIDRVDFGNEYLGALFRVWQSRQTEA